MRTQSLRKLKKRRSFVVVLLLVSFLVIAVNQNVLQDNTEITTEAQISEVLSESKLSEGSNALQAIEELEVKGRAPKTGYSRSEFSDGWGQIGACDVRNVMLAQAMTNVTLSDDDCIVLRGTLNDPYTGNTIEFRRGESTSGDVQIDHVVALSDAWQKGAQSLSAEERYRFANDPLNLLAVDGPANQKKGDSDAASWLPPNRSFRCRYIARQIAVKKEYRLWVSEAEKSAMKRTLNSCPEQILPIRE